jgi:hypothetical protein
MRKNSGERDIGRLHGVRIPLSLVAQQLHELMDKVRMRAAMASSLREAQMILAI